ncbi:MAG TPA: outer membrane beta-barrel protein [Niastella sp.]
MYPLHDDDLDRMSREAAEHFEVEPGASGWEHLENRLDKELPQKKKRRRFLFWLFFITATTGGIVTGILKYKPVTPLGKNVPGVVTPADQNAPLQNSSPANANTTSTAKNNPATGSASTPVSPAQPLQTTTIPQPITGSQEPVAPVSNQQPTTTNNKQPDPTTVLAATPDKNITKPAAKTTSKKLKPAPGVDKTPLTLNYATITPGNLGKDKRTGIKPSKRKPGQQQRITAGKNNQRLKPVPDNNIVPDTRITTDENTTREPVDNNTDPATAQAVSDTPVDSLKKSTVVTPAVADSVKTPTQEAVKKEEKRKKDKTKQPLELGLMAGPDMSTVAFGPLYKTGYNFGLQIGYRFSDRWSVNTGIIYTKKFYQADSQYFHYKNPNWNSNLDKVQGNCSMWEIPVNVRYDVSFNDKRRWFVSTGLSTYLMDKEYYTLHYISPSGNPYPVNLPSDSNSTYLFSIWNLSVGMERSLGRHFSIQAEPYLKVPLTGLGTGSMRMDSYGILFTLKYKPTFNTKKPLKNK